MFNFRVSLTMATFIRRMAIGYAFLTLFLSSDTGFLPGVDSFGINYGQVADNLPPPTKVVELLTSLKLTRARIYDTNPQVLSAFANSNIELIVTVENEILNQLDDPQEALQWVNNHVKPFVPGTKITAIQVGNEVFTDDDPTLIQYLVPAVVNIHNAISQLGINTNIMVTTPCSQAVLDQSYPPSNGSFKSEIADIMTQFLKFLSTTKSPFWINAYPFFAYKDEPSQIPLEYVLFNPSPGMVDPVTNLHYDNMLYAMVDAVVFAIQKLGFDGIEVKVSETGWPSKGDSDETGASVVNAATYNGNLLRRQIANEGTPLRPRMPLEVYLFALFNEDSKPGPSSERNYGLFQPDESMVYDVGLSNIKSSSSSASSSSSSSSDPSVSLNSSAHKGTAKDYKSLLICWVIVYLLLTTSTLWLWDTA